MIDPTRLRGTIAAIATPPGLGGIGIIRISGPNAIAIAQQLAPTLPPQPASHRLYLRGLLEPDSGEPLDQALVVVMHGPGSFTGEDVAELHCHGGPVHLRQILDAVAAAGARPAEPGEFTRRALLNGRLDLVQAEAIGDLIEARSEAACRLARRHLQGRLSRAVRQLCGDLTEALTLLEAGIDFSLEEHVFAVDRADLRRRLESVTGDLDRLLASYDDGRRLREGFRCVIAGRPNAGKSTLLNRLLEEERAIVAATPGTTRDWLDADFVLDGQLFTLVDTAGLRDATEAVEEEGVRRARSQLDSADLVLFVADASLGWSDRESAEIEAIHAPGILIWNKTDLTPAQPAPTAPPHWLGIVPASLRDGQGLDALRHLLRLAAQDLQRRSGGESATLSRARHRDALTRGRGHLRNARAALREALDDELVAVDVRLALDAVGEVVGVVTPEEILGRIFEGFCVGK